MAWRAEQIKIGNIPKPDPVPYDPSKKLIPFISEAERMRYGPQSQIEAEMMGFKAASKAKQPIDLNNRFFDVVFESRRLDVQEADIAYSLQQQTAQNEFLEQAYRLDKRAIAGEPIPPKAHTTPRAGFRRFLTKKNIAIAGGALLAGALLLPKSEHNTIEGIHPGSNGFGAQAIRLHSDFGSGWVGFTKQIGRLSNRAFGSKFPGMGNSNTFAGKTREEHTEFKADFASRWDPMRKLAKELFEETAEKSAFKQLTESPEFKGAIKEAMEGPGKLLGAGAQGQVHGYTAKMALGGKTHQFKFATKSAYTAEEFKRLKPGKDPNVEIPTVVADIYSKSSKQALERESQILGELGSMRTPSLYGQTEDNKLIMEMFEGLEDLKQGSALSEDEAKALTSFMKTAHKKGYTHTDLHRYNIARVVGEGGKREPVVLDWGTANRFQEVKGIGGGSEDAWRLSEKIISEEAERSIGSSVSARQYSEMSDLRRIKAHTSKTSTDAEHLAINSIMTHYNTIFSPNKTSEAVKASEAKVLDAAREVFGTVSTMRPSVGEEVGTAVMRKPRGTAQLSPPKKLPKQRTKAVFADTILEEGAIRGQPRTSFAYAKTILDKANIERSVKRNKKFRKNSTQAVGVGLRSSQTATKGHMNYGSTKM
jgi:hypothetical protein